MLRSPAGAGATAAGQQLQALAGALAEYYLPIGRQASLAELIMQASHVCSLVAWSCRITVAGYYGSRTSSGSLSWSWTKLASHVPLYLYAVILGKFLNSFFMTRLLIESTCSIVYLRSDCSHQK
jgi:hypothetical protein